MTLIAGGPGRSFASPRGPRLPDLAFSHVKVRLSECSDATPTTGRIDCPKPSRLVRWMYAYSSHSSICTKVVIAHGRRRKTRSSATALTEIDWLVGVSLAISPPHNEGMPPTANQSSIHLSRLRYSGEEYSLLARQKRALLTTPSSKMGCSRRRSEAITNKFDLD